MMYSNEKLNVFWHLRSFSNHFQDIVPYRPLLQARNMTSPVVFIVYRQSNGRTASVSSRWANIMAGPESGKQFDLSNFALDQQLTGPVTMNIMPVGKDPWAAQQRIDQRSGPNFCAQFISEGELPYTDTFTQRYKFSIYFLSRSQKLR